MGVNKHHILYSRWATYYSYFPPHLPYDLSTMHRYLDIRFFHLRLLRLELDYHRHAVVGMDYHIHTRRFHHHLIRHHLIHRCLLLLTITRIVECFHADVYIYHLTIYHVPIRSRLHVVIGILDTLYNTHEHHRNGYSISTGELTATIFHYGLLPILVPIYISSWVLNSTPLCVSLYLQGILSTMSFLTTYEYYSSCMLSDY